MVPGKTPRTPVRFYARPIVAVLDDAAEDPDSIRANVLSGEFSDYRSEWDGAVYPAINADLDPAASVAMVDLIAEVLDRPIDPKAVFSRAMFGKTMAPNKIHSDAIMGGFAAHLYLSPSNPDGTGTSFWRHKKHGPVHLPHMPVEDFDCSDLGQWVRYASVTAEYNRLMIHCGRHWHLAEPIRGFGDSPESGRLVVTCFFDLS